MSNFMQKGICKLCKTKDFIANRNEKFCINCYREILFPERVFRKVGTRHGNNDLYSPDRQFIFKIDASDLNEQDEEQTDNIEDQLALMRWLRDSDPKPLILKFGSEM